MTIVIITVGAVSGFLYWHNVQQQRQDLIRNNLVLVKLVGEYTILPLVFDDKNGAKEQLSKLLQDPRIVYVRLKNANGDIITNFDPFNEAAGAPLFPAQQEWLWLDNRLHFAIEIKHNNQKLGSLTGAFHLDEYKHIQNSEQGFILIAVLVAVICSFVMAILLRRFVMSSIRQLEIHARRIAEQTEVDQFFSYPNRRNDEISQLYEAFNLLMKQVRNRETEILLLNSSLESKIKQRTEDLSAALRIKSAFLANMSHEIRTPMNAILGMHQLALETELTQKQHNYLTKANNAAKWLLGIINDVLDFSKLEAGKLRFEQINFELESLIHYLEEVATPLLNDKSVNLQFSVGSDVPKALLGDQLRLGQILLNLISNAIKFTESGTITVQIELLNIAGERVTLRFSVMDTGIGISEEQQQHLFDAFTQADNSTTRKYGGTGLGLAISKDLVEAMGGGISVESRLGIGSCFSFTCELGLASAAQAVIKPAAQSPVNRWQALEGLQVLLVEDNVINQELMLEVLGNHGLKVDLASNGAEAITLAENNRYDAVLMDCQMPVMDGFVATRTLRANPRFADLPIIAMTANVMQEDRERCLACGMNDHVGKPIDWNSLFQTLVRWVKTKSSTGFIKTELKSENALVESDFPTLAGVDRDAAQKIVSGNIALYGKLLSLVRDKHAAGITSIQSAYRAGDNQSAAQQAHALSGAMSAIGAMQLSGLMKVLQDKFNSHELAGTKPLLEQIEIGFNKLLDEINRICPHGNAGEHGPRILLVEDNPLNQEVAAEILEAAMFRVVTANDGKEALDLLTTQSFDAVLMDIHMPSMDGLETTRQIRRLPEGRDIPIIALTAAAAKPDVEAAFAAGMNAHIAKPIDSGQLREVLAKLLKQVAVGVNPIDSFANAKEPAASWSPNELMAELEWLALSLEAHEAVPQTKLCAIYEIIEHQFSPALAQKLAQQIEQFNYTNALTVIRNIILELKDRNAD